MKEIFNNYKGLVIGVSAGTMNLCKTVANFPEELVDLDEPRWLSGLGFYDGIVIPHFDGENIAYQIPCDEIDVVNDYILPLSKDKEFIGLPNGSYVLIDNNGSVNYYGDVYKISNGAVTKYFDVSKNKSRGSNDYRMC